ncbi:MAG: hypothetical protein HC925_06080, partial [Coleofasciculaceae cyanobacterium SM2_3_26]|nr:hypothetical protein [Coleofasciculaceae cyanobacterium SM2_3_26]
MAGTIAHNHDSQMHGHDAHADDSVHAGNPVKRAEHMALLDLVPHAAATHRAVNNGSWFDPNTWEGKRIPSAGARVLIPEGISLTYDGESNASLKTLRVDGALTFAADRNTQMVVDTFVTNMGSTLRIGTPENPVQADKRTRILIDGSEAIDRTWDPTLLSRGIITHGKVEIHGAEKTEFVALQGNARAGDSELVLKEVPQGWRIGDRLVLGGTSHNPNGSDADNTRFQDEVLTITAIDGRRIQFINNDVDSGNPAENPNVLRFDHAAPPGFEAYDLQLYVANTSRNVSIETLNATEVPIAQRGHVMFMHNPDVQVHNAGFYNLGRSDKST